MKKNLRKKIGILLIMISLIILVISTIVSSQIVPSAGGDHDIPQKADHSSDLPMKTSSVEMNIVKAPAVARNIISIEFRGGGDDLES